MPSAPSGLSRNAKVLLLTIGVIGAVASIWVQFFSGWFEFEYDYGAPIETSCMNVFSEAKWAKASKEDEDDWFAAWDKEVRTKTQIQGDDLIACGTMNGKTVEQVEDILGEGKPGTLEDGTEILSWPLGYERTSFGIDEDTLLLKIDENGRVTSSELGQG